MKMMICFVLSIMFSAMAFEAKADGRLGVCKRCVKSSGGDYHLWSGDYIGIMGFCKSLGMQGKDDGDPRQCDSNAGIVRFGSQNDPFWQCSTNPSNHSIWIGGENADLIVVGKNSSDISSGTLFRLRDGREYRCERDVASGANFSVVKYGENRDLLDIYVHDGENNFTRHTDNIFNGTFHAIEVGSNFVARLYGKHKDILKLYGIQSNGNIIAKSRFVNDGKKHTLHKLGPNAAGLTYGRKDDIRVRYCFDGTNWRSGYAGIGAGYTPGCNRLLDW